MIPLRLVQSIETALTEVTAKSDRIRSCVSIGGGSINNACKVEWANEFYFLKWNSASKYPNIFDYESHGLKQLLATNSIGIPEVLKVGKNETDAFILMEYIGQSASDKTFWEAFGKQLSDLHRNTTNYFGNDQDNYIGSLSQSNTKHDRWSAFFVSERLQPLVKMARDNQRISQQHAIRFDKLFEKIETLFPPEKPSLLHGDLWSGNFLCNTKGLPVLIDPAVYFGHREMDIAMTKLFGGFGAVFYESYNRHFLMEKGWEKRVELCNLYPLLVHLNLFGSSYLYDIERTLGYYV
jgi:fructosamine-3-kinase